MKKKLLLSLCALTVLCAGCGNKLEVQLKDGKEVIASLDGNEITAEELFDELKGTYGSTTLINMIDEYIANKEVKDSDALTAKANSEIASMKSYYESAGYTWKDVLTNYGYNNDDELLADYILSLKKETVATDYLKTQVADDEIDAYYEKEIYGDYTAKHILIIPDTDDDMTDEEIEAAKTEAYNLAKSIIKKLNNKEKWSDLVKKYSEDTASVEDDGKITFTKGDVVDEFFDATLALKDGEYTSEPVESTYGYHIITRVSATAKPELKDVKDDVISSIVTNKTTNDTTLTTTAMIEVRKKYNLNIADTTLNTKYQDSIN